MLSSRTLHGRTVLVLHAHPDDEAIFTGITLRRLADAGARVVLVLATAGELGDSRIPLTRGETLAHRRVAELEISAALLGVSRLALLGRRDSGLPGWPSGAHPRALASADRQGLARRIAKLAEAESADTFIYDDRPGIYGHPDHLAAHQVGHAAAEMVGGVTSYLATVDREHLHVTAPGGHLVHGAAEAAAVRYGRASAEITLAVSGGADHVACKRAAISAHASQIDPRQLPEVDFDAAYGIEWYRHIGAPGLLEQLGNVHLCAAPRHTPCAHSATVESRNALRC